MISTQRLSNNISNNRNNKNNKINNNGNNNVNMLQFSISKKIMINNFFLLEMTDMK